MPIETAPFDSARHLKTEADIARYLGAVLEENDPALRRHAGTQIDSTWAARLAKAQADNAHVDHSPPANQRVMESR